MLMAKKQINLVMSSFSCYNVINCNTRGSFKRIYFDIFYNVTPMTKDFVNLAMGVENSFLKLFVFTKIHEQF